MIRFSLGKCKLRSFVTKIIKTPFSIIIEHRESESYHDSNISSSKSSKKGSKIELREDSEEKVVKKQKMENPVNPNTGRLYTQNYYKLLKQR